VSDYRLVNWKEYKNLPRSEQTWIVDGIVPTGGLVNIYGRPKIGKSYLAMGLGLAIADPNMGNWMGYSITQHGRVAYIQVDTPREFWMDRMADIEDSGVSIPDDFYMADPELVPYPFNALSGDCIHLYNIIAALDPRPIVVFIDTLREIHSGNEDNSTDMRNVIGALVKAAAGSAIVLISHSRKGQPQFEDSKAEPNDDDLMNENRGSSYVAGRMDAIIRVSNKLMTFQSRAMGQQRVKITRHESGLFVAEKNDTLEIAQTIIDANHTSSIREQARLLADGAQISFEAARSAIRRLRDHKEGSN
jgi:hypothetical protein